MDVFFLGGVFFACLVILRVFSLLESVTYSSIISRS